MDGCDDLSAGVGVSGVGKVTVDWESCRHCLVGLIADGVVLMFKEAYQQKDTLLRNIRHSDITLTLTL